MSNQPITFETEKRFSESSLWQAQRDYYHEKGVEAWTGSVPFYITSNPFIADTYAKLTVRFVMDWIRQHPGSENHPFYVLEIGVGSGQFSFYVLQKLKYYQHQFGIDHVKICYVMTDFTENNLNYWAEHADLKPFLAEGRLDFSVFDMEVDHRVHLTHANKTLTQADFNNPLIAFANYLFDSVITDIVTIKDEQIYESLVNLSTEQNNIENNKPRDWKKIKFNYTEKLISTPYYENVVFDRVLMSYQKAFEDETHMLFPIGSLRGLEYLRELSNERLLLISSDKGYVSEEELADQDYPELDIHGSFSLMVNYDAIARYFRENNGDAFMQTPRGGLVSGVFASGIHFNDMPEFSLLVKERVQGFSPTDYFNVYESALKSANKTSLEGLVASLALSLWDPYFFEEINDRLDELMEDGDQETIDYLVYNLPNIAAQFYFIPGAHDIFFDIATIYQNENHYEQALKYFDESERYFGQEYVLYYNRGLCHYYLEQFERAKENFEKALEIKANDRDANEWLQKVKNAMSPA